MLRSRFEVVPALAALLLAASGADAQEDEPDPDAPEQENVSIPGLAIEEIIVYREQTLNTLRLEVYRAEEAFYDAFNAVNSDDEYDISCEYRRPTGTHMRFRVCEARFVKDLNAEYAESWLSGTPLPAVTPLMMAKGKLLLEEMKDVARENPDVLAAWLELAQTSQAFDAEHERRCGGRALFCRR